VPLSEHEQRLLEQMERALYAEDPKFASSLRGKDPRSNFRRRVLLAGVGFVVGVVLLMTGLVAKVILVSLLGFLFMLASVFFAVTSYRAVTAAAQLGVVDPSGVRRPPNAPSGSAGRRPKSSAGPGFMARMEERWNRRRDENGGR
jgi:predicted lipid-binding transport protein (Tim44 family)